MASRKALAEAWNAGLPARLQGSPADEDDGPKLEQIVRTAAMPLPGIALSDEALLRHLAQFAQTPHPDAESFSAMHLSDLCLAWACTEQDPRALELFEERLRPEVRKNTAHLTDADFERAWIPFCEELFRGVGGRPPKLREYSGRGELRKWLHLLFLRASKEIAAAHADDAGDAKYKDALQLAVSDALHDLPARDRALLLAHLVDGIEVQELAARAKEHTPSLQQRIRETRDNLLFATKKKLMHHASIGKEESERILRGAWGKLPELLRTPKK